MMQFEIDPDIHQAETLPASFYRDTAVFEALREKVFYPAWHWLGDRSHLTVGQGVTPVQLLDGFMDEPLIITKNKEEELCALTNICTHRANLISHNQEVTDQLLCKYHGRRFAMDGRFVHMPEFKEAANFPRPCDDLHRFELAEWGPFLFTSLQPAFGFDEIRSELDRRVGFLPLNEFKAVPKMNKDYLVNAHWALYCDNYLEGFHIPFVHAELNELLDYGSYETLLFQHMNLQVGYSSGGDEIFDLPEGHIDYGKRVAAYYFWVFPNLMLNFYPWGLSVNVVKPINKDKTKVSFITYVYDESKLHGGAEALIDKVEREDEFVVEGVHKGLQSRFYQSGRFSPTREQGVHHFHQLLARYVSS